MPTATANRRAFSPNACKPSATLSTPAQTNPKHHHSTASPTGGSRSVLSTCSVELSNGMRDGGASPTAPAWRVRHVQRATPADDLLELLPMLRKIPRRPDRISGGSAGRRQTRSSRPVGGMVRLELSMIAFLLDRAGGLEARRPGERGERVGSLWACRSGFACGRGSFVVRLSSALVASDCGLPGSEDRPDEDGDDKGDGDDQGDVDGRCGPAEGCDGHVVLLSLCG